MKDVLLIFSTLGGATENITKDLHNLLVEGYPSIKFEIESIENLDPVLFSKFDLTILGASTYDGDMNFDASEFFFNLEKNKKDLSGLKFALFGIGDRAYSEFCGGIDKVREKIIAGKGEVSIEVLKLEVYPVSEALVKLKVWANNFIEV